MKKAKAGFTLVELVVVLAVSAGLLALGIPVVGSLRTELALTRTVDSVARLVRQVEADALSGRAQNPDSLPSHYSLLLQTVQEGDQPAPVLAQSQNLPHEGPLNVLWNREQPWEDTAIILKEIRLQQKSVPQLWIVAMPPLAHLELSTDPNLIPLAAGADFKDTTAELVFASASDESQSHSLFIP